MKTVAKIIYRISLAFVFLMLVLFCIFETTDEYIRNDEAGYSILTDYEAASYEDEASPTGITQEYKWILRNIPKRNGAVAFYVVHQEIEIYVDGELLYSFAPGVNNLFSHTTGYRWAKVYLYPEDEGKEIKILVRPLYKTSVSRDLTIYYGNFDAIFISVVQDSMPIILVSLISIIIGLAFILFVVLNCRNPEMDTDIVMLGIFSVFTGVWKITDMTAAPLLFGNPLFLSALTLISLPVMVVSFVFFLRNQFGESRHRILDISGSLCSLLSIVIVLLQITGTADLRQTLFLSHIMFLSISILILYIILWELKNKRLSKKLKITFCCCILCLFGSIIDMSLYILSGNSGGTIFGICAFLVYSVFMGYLSLREALYLIKRGKEANHFEQLALHDQLTGLYSRIFYSQYVEKQKKRRESCFLLMFDVNNLKMCNDTKGHLYGDRLLCDSAHLLEQAFLPDGICIRLGGDEFCVIFRRVKEEEIQKYLAEFDQLLTVHNKLHSDEFPIEIAYGYAYFDETKDSDLNDTLRRADQKMYEMKHKMKD